MRKGVIAGALLLFSVVTAAAQTASTPDAISEDEQPQINVAIEWDQYWNGAEREQLRKVSKLHPMVLTSSGDDLEKEADFPLDDVVRGKASFELPAGPFVYWLETKSPHEFDKIRNRFLPGGVEAEVDGRTTYSNLAMTFCRLTPNSFIFVLPASEFEKSSARLISTIGDDGGKPAEAKGLPPLLKIDVLPNSLREKFAGAALPPVIASLASAKDAQASVLPKDGKLVVQLSLTFSDEAAAAAGLESLRLGSKPLVEYLQFIQREMPPGMKRLAIEHPGATELEPLLSRVLGAAEQGVSDAAFEVAGATATATIDIQSEQPVSDAILLMSVMTPRAKKP